MSDAPPLRSDEIVVGCVTEDNPKFLGQTLRLLQSIRWFGGSLAETRVVIGAVEGIDRRARRTFESLGAEVHVVPRFEQPNGSANRLQLIPVLREKAASHYLMLDCDTIVVRDPLPLIRRGVFHAKIAPFPTVTHAVFERLFRHFGLPLPERTYVTGYSRTPTIPYFNAGVFSVARDLAERLVPEWRHYNAVLAAEPALAAPCARHLHQAALALALASTGVPVAEMGPELNYQLNDTRRPPRAYVAVDPVIIHYHHLVDDDGLLLPCPFPRAQARIDEFNERLREDRARAMTVRRDAPAAAPSRQIVVLGAPRAGTSLAAQLLTAMGCVAGDAHELQPPDVYHPGVSWRRRDVAALHDELLTTLGATWLVPERADVTRLAANAKSAFTEKARAIATRLDQHRSSLLHDPRATLFFPLWREVLNQPLCVLVHRDPLATARALARATGLPLVIGLAVWEEYTRTMLAATAGLPRMLVSYEDLVAGGAAAFHRQLVAAGAADLRLPDAAELRAMILPTEDTEDEQDLLDATQRELRDALRSGVALQWDVVPPTRRETRELLSAFGRNEAAAHRAAELQRRLDAVTASRVWRVGSRVASLWRRWT